MLRPIISHHCSPTPVRFVTPACAPHPRCRCLLYTYRVSPFSFQRLMMLGSPSCESPSCSISLPSIDTMLRYGTPPILYSADSFDTRSSPYGNAIHGQSPGNVLVLNARSSLSLLATMMTMSFLLSSYQGLRVPSLNGPQPPHQ